jgi:7-keto-8-aminopelargonate synthetase-like enzyme
MTAAKNSDALIDMLGQRARPSPFPNALPATVAFSASAATDTTLREPERLPGCTGTQAAARRPRAIGFAREDSPSAIATVRMRDAVEVEQCSNRLFELGFSWSALPVRWFRGTRRGCRYRRARR